MAAGTIRAVGRYARPWAGSARPRRAAAGMTWTETSSPTRRAAAAPASVAAFTAPTSPRTMTVTYPAPMYSLPMSDDVGGLDHRVGRFDRADESYGFDETRAPLQPLCNVRGTLTDCGRCGNCGYTFAAPERLRAVHPGSKCMSLRSSVRSRGDCSSLRSLPAADEGSAGTAGRDAVGHAQPRQGAARQPDRHHLQVRRRARRDSSTRTTASWSTSSTPTTS